MRIYIYTLIGPAIERRRIRRGRAGLFRNRLRRAIDYSQWRAFGRFPFRYDVYEDFQDTNAGDIAIRIALREHLERALKGERAEFVEISWGTLDDALVNEINEQGSLVAIAGGYIHFTPAGDLKPPLPTDAEFLSRIRCPVALLGAGANCKVSPSDETPGLNAPSMAILRGLLNHVSLCAVRDQFTADIVAAAGHPSRVIGDPVLFLDHPHAGATGARLPGVRIGLNFGFHGPHSQAVFGRNLNAYVEFARTMRDRHQCRFYYFVHSDGEQLVVRLLRASGIDIEVIEGPAATLLSGYQKMTIQVSHMMHSCIMAVSCGTPVISLAYDIKNRSFSELMGDPEAAINVFDVTAERLIERAEDLIRRRDGVSTRLQARKAELSERNDVYGLAAGLALRYEREAVVGARLSS